MFQSARLRLGGLIVALFIVLAGCAGSSGGSGKPSDVVRQALTLADTGDLTGIAKLACAAKKDAVAAQFNFGGMLSSLPAGIDAAKIFDAISLDTSALTLADVNVSGDNATVQMGGSLKINLDAGKLKDMMKAAAQQAGRPVDDATLDALVTQIGALSQSVPMTESVAMVRENGAWKICES